MNQSESLWENRIFSKLYAAHAASLAGSGMGAVALGLLAHELVGASASTVLGVALTIRIVVIVLLSPWAGMVANRFGVRRTLVACDVLRVIVVLGFLAADSVWQIYVLAFLLHAGSALFTPVYKATIPGVVGEKHYPHALAWGTVAYDASNILAPVTAGLVIVLVGFEGNFVLNACAFGLSAWLIFGLPRLAIELPNQEVQPKDSPFRALSEMLSRWPLRLSLLLALQASVAGAVVLVGTIGLVKTELVLGNSHYAWLMAAYGLGSVAGAFFYARATSLRLLIRLSAGILMTLALGVAAFIGNYGGFFPIWAVLGAGQAVLSIRGNEILARSTLGSDRTPIFSAHFALSHLGWGIFYPVSGWSVTTFGFAETALAFSFLLAVLCLPQWIYAFWLWATHRHLPGKFHEHTDLEGADPFRTHRHGDVEHRHFHLPNWP